MPACVRAGRRSRSRVPPSAKQAADTGADTRPETCQVNAPPDHGDGPAYRVVGGHVGTEEATSRPQGEEAQPKSDGNPVAPAAGRLRGGSRPVRPNGLLSIPG